MQEAGIAQLAQWLSHKSHNLWFQFWWARDFCLLQNILTGSRSHPASYTIVIGICLFMGEVARAWADHSPPSSTKVKNHCSHTSNLSICFCGLRRDNFTLLYLSHNRGLGLQPTCYVSIPENANSLPHKSSLSTVIIKFTYRLFSNTINI
jgi:hypothetical protein